MVCTVALLAIGISVSSGCKSWQTKSVTENIRDHFMPSNDRVWRPEYQEIPSIEVRHPQYTLRNIRNCSYLTPDDFVVDYYDRDILLGQIQSVDFIVVPFNQTRKLAHTMMSFGLDDGSYISLSVEVRKELGEKYNPLKGFGPNFEIIYVLSDERDVIRLRTRHRESDVYVYPTVASPQQAQALFVDVVQRINKLAVEPEFYNSVNNNCTTNLAGHVNEVSPKKINYGWKVLLPGFSAEYAYELGLLDNRIPYEDLTTISLVNDLAEEHFDDPNFSQLIRGKRGNFERYLALQQRREATLRGRGDQLLEARQAPRGLSVRSTRR